MGRSKEIFLCLLQVYMFVSSMTDRWTSRSSGQIIQSNWAECRWIFISRRRWNTRLFISTLYSTFNIIHLSFLILNKKSYWVVVRVCAGTDHCRSMATQIRWYDKFSENRIPEVVQNVCILHERPLNKIMIFIYLLSQFLIS